jgi:hypothetical protein
MFIKVMGYKIQDNQFGHFFCVQPPYRMTTCHGSSGENMRCQYLEPHAIAVFTDHIKVAVSGNMCNLNSGDHTRCFCWGTHMMEVLGKTWDVISGGHIQWKFWGQCAMLFLETTSYTGVKLKSPPSGVRILNCHMFIYSV